MAFTIVFNIVLTFVWVSPCLHHQDCYLRFFSGTITSHLTAKIEFGLPLTLVQDIIGFCFRVSVFAKVKATKHVVGKLCKILGSNDHNIMRKSFRTNITTMWTTYLLT